VGKRERHEPGTFSWVDLGTTDVDGAKAFYAALFGWEGEDLPVGEGMTYTMLHLNGETVAAMYAQSKDQQEQDLPPNWMSYVTVEDAGATAEKARTLGATVLTDALEVMDAGSMAVIQDPTGAILSLWQPKDSIGATLVNAAGALTWTDLNTPDMDAAAEFYSALFGWDTEKMDTPPDTPGYTIIRNGGRSNGGMMELTGDQEGIPAHWLPYFAVESTDAAVERLSELGGEVLAGPMDVPAARIAAVRDPQGAAFAVLQGDLDD
jgi:predicted enzyme related to lactoylglutathione lyase